VSGIMLCSYDLMENAIFLEQRGECCARLFWLTSHQQCHWAWGNSGISIFVHKVQYTLDTRTRMQLPLLKKNCALPPFSRVISPYINIVVQSYKWTNLQVIHTARVFVDQQ